MRRFDGKSLSEYALIGALVVVVAIPAVLFLGNVISSGTDTNAANIKSGADELASMLDTGQADPYAGLDMPGGGADMGGMTELPGGGGGAPPPMGGGSGGESAGDGTMTLPDGSTTTSAEGTTELIADLIDQMIAGGGTLDGVPLSDMEIDKLEDLAYELHALAQEQGDYIYADEEAGSGGIESKWDSSVALYDAFSTMASPEALAAVTQMMHAVGHATTHIDAHGEEASSVNITIPSSMTGPDPNPNMSESEVPGFTDATATLMETNSY